MKESQVTSSMIEEFLSDLEAQGKSKSNIDNYGRTLKRWYESLPEDKRVAEDASVRWAVTLSEKGVADANITIYVSRLNRFLKVLPAICHCSKSRSRPDQNRRSELNFSAAGQLRKTH